MEVQFTPDQQAFVHEAIKGGRLQREEDAIEEALLLWEEQERGRLETLSVIEKSEASYARGNYRRIASAEDARRFIEDVKRRGMARLLAEQNCRA